MKDELSFEEKIDEKYKNLSVSERKKIYDMYFDKNSTEELKKSLEKLVFHKLPPTAEEFLDPKNGWVAKDTPETMFPWIRQELITVISEFPSKQVLVEYGATRIGKTFLAVHMMLYTIIFFHCLREPALYYGLSSLTELAIYIISFNYDKTRELYLKPLFKIMDKSPNFKQVRAQDQVYTLQNKLGRDIIVYSKAATTGEMTLASGLQIQMGNDDALAFVGANIVQAYVSELAFWLENNGATEEQIYRLYTDLKERIDATVGENYLAFLYLDTSANLADSKIEQHILNELRYRESTHFSWRSRWSATPFKAKKWYTYKLKLEEEGLSEQEVNRRLIEDGYTFKVVTGAGNIPIKIDAKQEDLKDTPKDLIIDVPIDYLHKYIDNPIKSIKDISGVPTVRQNKFITDISLINGIFDNNVLTNVEGIVIADSKDEPKDQVWNQIYSMFFNKTFEGEFIFKRAPKEPRYWGLDNAFSLKGDIMGLACTHKEWSSEKDHIIHVIDFCFTIGPGKNGISLDAPTQFILDTIEYAGVYFYAGFADTFHSENQKQKLERCNVKLIKQSVDTQIAPYQYIYSCLTNGWIKGGRNMFLKNNLDSLIITKDKKNKDKVNHIEGLTNNDYRGDWDHSTCGVNAKDCSDALAQSVYGSLQHQYIPSTVYEEENKRFSSKKEDKEETFHNAFEKLTNLKCG